MDDDNEKQFMVEYAKTGRANCKKCKQSCEAGKVRMAKVLPSPFGSGKMNNWYHIDCIFESFKTQRASTKSIETIDDISGWETIGDLDKDSIMEKLEKLPTFSRVARGTLHNFNDKHDEDEESTIQFNDKHYNVDSKDNLFREFRKICLKLSEESSYLGKTAILHKFFLKGCNGERFEGKLLIWIKMLLPSVDRRVYNLQSKQLIKLFARIFNCDAAEMLTHLEQGDVALTISEFFEKSDVKPAEKSQLTLQNIDKFLDKLSQLSREDEQITHFRRIVSRCTSSDLQMLIRLIKHDIRINAGPKHILEALSKNAYPAYQSSRNLADVVAKFGNKIHENKLDMSSDTSIGKQKKGNVGVQLMSPISPMLAEACKSVEKAIEKCPAGMYSEIKYDGERVQLHKKGDEFKFFSRNLKAVQEHKIKACEEFIPKAFPNANDLILDSEIIAVDTSTGELLPFGTLGKHKKTEHKTAEVCLFVFDCIYYNGTDLTKKTMKERREILEKNIRPIKNHVQLSEYHVIKTPKELSVMIAKVLQMGLEGLVLKNVNGIYEPGKRHWLKVKKDYLFDGKMADSADLVVLGAWFGTGKKGGMLSIFLMGCMDSRTKLWKTVTKVHTGLDDKTLDKMQKILLPLLCRADPDNPPSWLKCKKPMIPDMLTKDPYKMPVWEITGAEFSKSDIHTADGISIRFPRITKERTDKSAPEATTLHELNKLYETSKDCVNLQMLTDGLDDAEIDIKTKLQGIDKQSPNKPKKIEVIHSTKKTPQHFDDEDDIELCQITNEIEKKISLKIGSKKRKPAYYDSSDDETTDKKLHKADIYLAPKAKKDAANIATVTTTIATAKQMAPKDEDKNKKVKEIEEEEEEAEEKEDVELPTFNMKNKSIESNETSAEKHIAKNPFINIFEGIRLYVPPELRDCLKEELRYFQLWGGQEINFTKKCTHVLHKKRFTTENWNDIRAKYLPRCSHIYYAWLVKSVSQQQLDAIENYAVTLKLT